MKKRLLSAMVALAMVFSITSVAFADNNNENEREKKDKIKIEFKKDKEDKGSKQDAKKIRDLQKDIKEVELKIAIVKKQLKLWTDKKAEVEKKLGVTPAPATTPAPTTPAPTTTTTTPAPTDPATTPAPTTPTPTVTPAPVKSSADQIRVELFTRQLADLEAWHTAAIAVAGLTADQISEINKVYESEKKALTSRLEKSKKEVSEENEGLKNALNQAIKKIEMYTKELEKLNAKLVELKAKLAAATPTPAPVVSPTPVVTPVPTTVPPTPTP